MVEFAKFKNESQIYLDEEKMYSNSNPIKPQRLMKDLRESLPRDAIVFVDGGNSLHWTTHYFPVYLPEYIYYRLWVCFHGIRNSCCCRSKICCS